jgi:site-specific DNA-methyltransferase (adenine-specific)/site-specific DNA-methyltransferase (cytosine-N4-specific)
MGHPAAFPVGVPAFFIKLFTRQGDMVLDPFAGSGSTGIAAEQLNRNVVLIDNKLEYFKIIQKRLEKTGKNRERYFYAPEPVSTNVYQATPMLLESKGIYSTKVHSKHD